MNWKIVKTKEDLPQDDELILVYGKTKNGDVKFFEPKKWNKDGYPAKWFLIFNIFDEFGWCKIEPPK